ncbi:MAG: hypothetical protein V6Z86_06265 [Hyphomicrobiales bacterium]
MTMIDDSPIALRCLFRHSRAFGSTRATAAPTLASIVQAMHGTLFKATALEALSNLKRKAMYRAMSKDGFPPVFKLVNSSQHRRWSAG